MVSQEKTSVELVGFDWRGNICSYAYAQDWMSILGSLGTVPPDVLEAMLLRLVERIVADVAVITVVGKGITEGLPAV